MLALGLSGPASLQAGSDTGTGSRDSLPESIKHNLALARSLEVRAELVAGGQGAILYKVGSQIVSQVLSANAPCVPTAGACALL